MEKTIAEKMPEQTRALAASGRPNIAALARCHVTFADIDRALGYAGAAHHWFNGTNRASNAAEVAAGYIINGLQRSEPKPRLETVPEPKPTPAADDSLLMVVCPPANAAKVRRVLAMLGCEVEAI